MIKENVLKTLASKYPGRAAYVYDLDGIESRLKFFKDQFSVSYKIHFAMKTNHFPAILKVVREGGAGVDVVSGGEMSWAFDHGFKGDDIVFSGVGKSAQEIECAIKGDVRQLNVESGPELRRVIQIAKALKKKVKVAIRVNPDVAADTHPYIRTGLKENKFGIDFESAEQIFETLVGESAIELVGCSLHIGSQIRDITPFRDAILKTLSLYEKWQSKIPSLKAIDIGGGLGMDYVSGTIANDQDLIVNYAKTIRSTLDPWLKTGKLNEVVLEPGRVIVARFGTLLAQVEYVKRTSEKNFLIVNTGMHHLMRPMLYQAFHRIECLGRKFATESEMFDVVGPICESTDTLGRERLMPADVQEGDWIAIRDAGAYGAVMKNNYNLQLEPVEISMRGGELL